MRSDKHESGPNNSQEYCEAKGGSKYSSGRSISVRRYSHEPSRARILEPEQVEQMLAHIERTSNAPRSDEVKLVLSFYAGLRASEIAGLTLRSMLNADGEIGHSIVVSSRITKTGRERVVPMHPRVKDALIRFRKAHPDVEFIAFSNLRGIRRQTVKAVTNWFARIYREMAFEGCSSHSGRRTFVTTLARNANRFNRSLRDVQILAGHVRLSSTEAYIDPSENLTDLVNSLGASPKRRAV